MNIQSPSEPRCRWFWQQTSDLSSRKYSSVTAMTEFVVNPFYSAVFVYYGHMPLESWIDCLSDETNLPFTRKNLTFIWLFIFLMTSGNTECKVRSARLCVPTHPKVNGNLCFCWETEIAAPKFPQGPSSNNYICTLCTLLFVCSGCYFFFQFFSNLKVCRQVPLSCLYWLYSMQTS